MIKLPSLKNCKKLISLQYYRLDLKKNTKFNVFSPVSSCFVKTSNRIWKYKITSPWEITETDLFDVVGLPCSQLFEQWCFRFKGKIESLKIRACYQLLLFWCLFFPFRKGNRASYLINESNSTLHEIINNNGFFSLFLHPPPPTCKKRKDALSKRGNCSGKVNKNSLLHMNDLTLQTHQAVLKMSTWCLSPPICDLPASMPDSGLKLGPKKRTKKKPYKNKRHFKWILNFTAKLISSNTVWLSIKQTNCSKASQASHQTISSWVCSVRTFPQSAHAGVDRKKKRIPGFIFPTAMRK